MKPKTWNSNKIEYDIVGIYRPWIIYKSWYCIRRLIFLHHIVLLDANFQSCSIQALLNTFAYPTWIVQMTTARSSLRSTLAYMLKGMDPTPHAIMPRNWRMWLKANLTNVGLGTSNLYYKSFWSLSHFKSACLLAWAMAFYSLWRKQARVLFKTCTFMDAWFWILRPSSRVDGHLCLLGSITTLWHACKWCTKLYLAIHDASHPSTLQANLGPSLSQWTPFMAIRGGLTTVETKKNKNKI